MKHPVLSFLFRLVSFALLFTICYPILSCREEAPNLKKADRLSAQGLYIQAEEFLRTALSKNYVDTMQYMRIRNRLKIIYRFRFFKPLDTLIAAKKWQQASVEWYRLNNALKDSSEKTMHFYGFDLFHKKSRIDSAMGSKKAYWSAIKKGLQFPSTNTKYIRQKYEELGFYLAEQDSLEEARAMFDRSLRILRVTELSDSLKEIYFSYMEGHFEGCLHLLKSLPDTVKDNHWRNLQFFLDKYGKELTLDERFKLW